MPRIPAKPARVKPNPVIHEINLLAWKLDLAGAMKGKVKLHTDYTLENLKTYLEKHVGRLHEQN
jgi:hypothetical protein